MRSVTHFLRYSSLKCSKQTFTVRSAIVNSFTSSVFPWEVNGKTEKNSFSPLEDFTLLVTFRNSKTRRHSETKQTSPSTKQDFPGEALSKQNTEASLASLWWLVPGDDRVVRHICIRCIQIRKTFETLLSSWPHEREFNLKQTFHCSLKHKNTCLKHSYEVWD